MVNFSPLFGLLKAKCQSYLMLDKFPSLLRIAPYGVHSLCLPVHHAESETKSLFDLARRGQQIETIVPVSQTNGTQAGGTLKEKLAGAAGQRIMQSARPYQSLKISVLINHKLRNFSGGI